jgi:uncharacterized protein (UPF0335 family)
MSRRLHDALLWLSGVDRATLARCPEGEEARFVAAGGAVLATAVMAAISGTFTFVKFLHAPLALAALLGVLFALMIMNLERCVQTSLRRQRHWALTGLFAAPRIALSYFMGLVITIPLMLAVFASDIGKQAVEDRNEGLHAARTQLDKQFSQIPALQGEQSQLQQQLREIKPGVVLEQSPEYQADAHRMGVLKTWVRTTPNQKLVRSYEREINTLGPQMRTLRTQLLADESNATDAAHMTEQARLDQITPQLQRLEQEKADRDAGLKARFAGPIGLAADVTALDHVSAHQPGVGKVKNVLVTFLVAVDSLPTLLLTLLLMGEKTIYERTLNAEEQASATLVRDFEERRIGATNAQTAAHFAAQRGVAEARLKRQLQLQREMDEIFIDAVGEQLRPATERLAREAAVDYVRRLGDPHGAPEPRRRRTSRS